MTAYVVYISSHAYHVRSAHDDLITAMREAVNSRPTSFVCVVRDGKDAKRYSIAECEAHLQRHYQNKPNSKHRKRRSG